MGLSEWLAGCFGGGGIICCCRRATAKLLVRQRGVASELSSAIPAAISTSESLDGAMSQHLPAGDSLSTTLSSPQFSQALSMFWSALQSGQTAPVVQQFGLGPEAVSAAASGNIEQFVDALESEAKVKPESAAKDQEQPAEQTKPQQPKPAPKDKKDDDDEGMALD